MQQNLYASYGDRVKVFHDRISLKHYMVKEVYIVENSGKSKKSISKADIAVRGNHHATTGNHMPYEITQCYLPHGSGDFSAFTAAEADTRFRDPGGLQS